MASKSVQTLVHLALWAASANALASPCATIQGAPSVTATRDQGATLWPTEGRMAPVSYTLGLLAMPQPGLLYAAVGARLQRSLDGGCHWAPWLDLTRATGGALLRLSAAGAADLYAWSEGGMRLVAVFDGQPTTVTAPGNGTAGVGVHPARPRQLRVVDQAGVVWDSRDAGAQWRELGRLPVATWVYRAAFDPRDPDHIVVGTMGEGAWVSRDGGRHWAQASGLGAAGEAVNVFNLAVSPARPQRVWAMGLNIAEADRGAPSGGRHIYRSDDGGRSYTPVVDQDARVTLTNGPLLAPHPTQPAVLYFVFGTHFMGYGTDLYRYSSATDAVTLTHNAYDEIGAIAFHPQHPRLMYLGLNNERAAGR